jgi:hypothetical protein
MMSTRPSCDPTCPASGCNAHNDSTRVRGRRFVKLGEFDLVRRLRVVDARVGVALCAPVPRIVRVAAMAPIWRWRNRVIDVV